MKLLSLQKLYQGLTAVVKRFPLQFIIILTATFCLSYYIDLSSSSHDPETHHRLSSLLLRIVAVCNLAFTLLIALDLFAESRAYAIWKKWMMRLAGLLTAIVLFWALDPVHYTADLYRVFLFSFAFHLLIAFAPFLKQNSLDTFWQYNKTLFLRFLTAALYAAVLFAGLAIALAAVDGLFSADIKFKVYLILFAVISVGFSSVFFLAGIPLPPHLPESGQHYPKGLKIFSQFVLIPLVTIYLSILLVYEVKILLQWELPKGMVSGLILGYAVFGILSLLLVYPIRDTEGNRWIHLFSRFFYVMLIPLIILLLLAVWKRVGHYGITESRYILILLALWLTGITLYFLFSKKQNISLIPITLCILSIFSTYGPQSAFAVSRYSQVARLKKLMKSEDKKDRGERSSVIRYLIETHGLISLQAFTNQNLSRLEAHIDTTYKSRYGLEAYKIDTAMTILKVKDDIETDKPTSLELINPDQEILNVKGYDYLIALDNLGYKDHYQFQGNKLSFNKEDDVYVLHINDELLMKVDYRALSKQAFQDYDKGKLESFKNGSYQMPANMRSVIRDHDGFSYHLVTTTLTASKYTPDNNYWCRPVTYLLIKKL